MTDAEHRRAELVKHFGHGQEPRGRQLEVLTAIYDLREELGFPPSFAEIGEVVGINHHNGVTEHLLKLEAMGCITRQERSSRTILVTALGHKWLGVGTFTVQLSASEVRRLEELRAERGHASLRWTAQRLLRELLSAKDV